MKKQWYSTRHSIFLILTYGLFMTGWNLDYSSASFIDCRSMMFKAAKKHMDEIGAEFTYLVKYWAKGQ